MRRNSFCLTTSKNLYFRGVSDPLVESHTFTVFRVDISSMINKKFDNFLNTDSDSDVKWGRVQLNNALKTFTA